MTDLEKWFMIDFAIKQFVERNFSMTHFDKQIEYYKENKSVVASLIESAGCGHCPLGCREYCKTTPDEQPCIKTILEWFEQKHTELLFPIGTIVEVELGNNGERDLQYYNGVYDGRHFCTHFFTYIGRTDSTGRPRGLIFNKDNIRKVGD